jgi:hypothetical protein
VTPGWRAHETGILKIPLPEGLADVRGGSSHIHTRVISPCKGEYALGFMCDRPRRHEPVLAVGGVNRFHEHGLPFMVPKFMGYHTCDVDTVQQSRNHSTT